MVQEESILQGGEGPEAEWSRIPSTQSAPQGEALPRKADSETWCYLAVSLQKGGGCREPCPPTYISVTPELCLQCLGVASTSDFSPAVESKWRTVSGICACPRCARTRAHTHTFLWDEDKTLQGRPRFPIQPSFLYLHTWPPDLLSACLLGVPTKKMHFSTQALLHH